MFYIKLTNQVTRQPIWINTHWIAHIDECASGSRVVLAAGNTGITRIVTESPEEILKKIGVQPENAEPAFNLTTAY